MLEQLRDMLTPPIFSNEDQNRLTSFLNIILLVCICLTCVNVLSRLLFTPDFLDGLWINAISVLIDIGLWFMLRRGRAQFVGYALSTVLWLIVSAVVLSSGNGLQDPSFISFTILIVIAGLSLGGRGALVMAALTSIVSLPLITPASKLLWLNYNMVFVMIAILIGIARHSIFQASNRARQSEQALQAQNEQLRSEMAEHTQTRIAQRAAEDKYRSIVENALEGIFQTTADGRILSANPALARMLGYASPQELISTLTNLAEQVYVDPDQREVWKSLMESQGEVRGFEFQGRCKDGRIISVSLNSRTVRDENGTLLYYEGIAEDITERKQHEATIRAQEQFLRQVIDNNPSSIFVKDSDGRFVLVNCAFADFHGLTVEQAVGKTDRDFPATEEQIEGFLRDDHEVMTSLKPKFISQEVCTSLNGQVRWSQSVKVPLIGTDGKSNRVLVVATDITQRKKAMESLAQERNLLRTLIDHLPENIYIKDRQSRFLVNNAVSMRLLGVSRQEDLIWKNDFDFFPREIAEPWYAQEQALMESGEAILDKEEQQPWRGEKRRWIEGSLISLRDSDGQIIGILGMNRDITERKRAKKRFVKVKNAIGLFLD